MNSKRFRSLVALAVGACGQAGGLLHLHGADSRPHNVVIFLADDAGWGDYSHSGNRQVRPPHIDSIARGGVSLDRFSSIPCFPHSPSQRD